MMSTKKYPMKSDVREKKDSYLLEIDIPGCQKEDIKVSIDKGYLEVEASMNVDKEHKTRKFVRKECYCGVYKRSFYVGDSVTDKDIKASYKHGVLKVQIPKITEAASKGNLITIQ